jgi:hypothetical protein
VRYAEKISPGKRARVYEYHVNFQFVGKPEVIRAVKESLQRIADNSSM